MLMQKEFLYDPNNELNLEVEWDNDVLVLDINHLSGAEAAKFVLDTNDCYWLIDQLDTFLRQQENNTNGEETNG